ncbi:DUF3152 domain-containing protein [Streptomyces sp. NPDC053367]|uniref:DUF3152 domain-containing protein n=1 Tax=Streptomyces sp. NPDC053367 TaxID=3365700 RepID=UPI0037CFD57C
MGRHSRRGPAPKGTAADTGGRGKSPGGAGAAGAPPEREPRPRSQEPQGRQPQQQQPQQPRPQFQPPQTRPATGRPASGAPGYGVPRRPDGTPAQGVPRFGEGTPAHGVPRFPDGTPAHGVPRFPDGTPVRGVPRFPGGAPAQGAVRFPDGASAQGAARFADGTSAQRAARFDDGTPAHGVPRFPGGTPAHGVPQVRGGHPQQREAGGGWGEVAGASAGAGAALPRQRQAPPGGPRREYIAAFDPEGDGAGGSLGGGLRRRTATASGGGDPYGSVTQWEDAPPRTPEDEPVRGKGGKGRAFTGIAAAAVTTVLAVVVAGQVTDRGEDPAVGAQAAAGQGRGIDDSASRGDGRPTPSTAPSAVALTYEQKMDRKYPLAPKLAGPGRFYAVPGIDKAPGRGQKFTYRVDVEQGLGLDGELFAQAVHKTLNDDRSWAHNGGRTFERVHSGQPDFVITLASPGTTAEWCAKSGLDTTVDNVSCDSAATERVMINAYRWAQGSKTYGDEIHAYRQMLINHEVGHRLGFHHVTCDKDGDLAPVMQQQTKFLDHDGVHCRPNPWAYPGS